MEPLGKKSPAGISGFSFASAAAGKGSAAPSATASAASTTSGASGQSSKNGSNASSNQSSPALGSQSPALGSVSGTDKGSPTSLGAIDWVLGKHVKVVTLADEVFEGQVYAFDVIMNCVCPSKLVSSSPTPAAYYSPSLGNSSSASRPKYDFRILKINYIKEVSAISTGVYETEGIHATDAQAGEESSATITTSTKNDNGNAVLSSANTSTAKDDNAMGITGGDKSNTSENNGSNITSNIYSKVLPAVGYVQLERIQQREQQAVREAQAAAARIGVGVSSVGQDIFDALSKTLPCRWAKDSIVVMDEVIIAPPYEPENCKANASSSYTLARVKKVLEGERSRMANGRK
ncbi:hypothetical protein BGX28_006830 [Mortierella sp. GBA30]|nr:hypothetical protein BGX28_006830 [Mortierella sp. GBA30]